jgi:S1-C subfamily serine protease
LYSDVTVLDWGIIAFTLAVALWGYRQGLVVGLMTLAGFCLGAFAGGHLAPLLLSQGASSPYAPLFAALGVLIVGAVFAVAFESYALAVRSRLIRGRALLFADGAGGAALIATVGLGVVWVFGAVALHAPGATQLRADVQRSLILRSLNAVLPPSGPILNALNRVDPGRPFAGPTTPVAPPNARIASDSKVLRAGPSVVRVLGTACGLGVEGSGWVAQPGLVVTNAHVVAGETDTTVTTQDGALLDAVPVHYDPHNDLALLRIGAELPVLPLAPEPRRGEAGAVLGYPENGPYTLTPARLGATQSVISDDSYGHGPIRRLIASLRGDVRSGDSGGPLVDPRGQVLGTVFAATTSGPTGGFAVPNRLVENALAGPLRPVSTGSCTS